MQQPKISVICPSFNHEKYVSNFIQSILSQTEQSFELIIVDDNSTDGTVTEIKKFTDPRIKLIQHEYNKGINEGINTAFLHASADILVFIASDDALHRSHFEKTLSFFEKNLNINVLYYSLSLMDEHGKTLEDVNNTYELINTSRFILLNKMFYLENQIPSPGMCVRKNAFEKIFPLSTNLLQLQDYKLHIDLLLENEIFLNSERLVLYRLPSIHSGISARSNEAMKREDLELDMLLNTYLKIKDVGVLKKIFPKETNLFCSMHNHLIPFYLGSFALNASSDIRKMWGYQTILRFLNNHTLQLIYEQHNYQYSDIINLVKHFNFHPPLTRLQKLKCKCKKILKHLTVQ